MEVAAAPNPGRALHWKRVILIPTVMGLVGGFLASYSFPSKYTSQSLVLIDGPTLPESIAPPLITEDLAQRVSSIEQRILGQSHLSPLVNRLGLTKSNRTVDDAIEDIRNNLTIEPVVVDVDQTSKPARARQNGPSDQPTPIPGFTLNYTASNPKEARDVCTELTSMLIEENLKFREARINGIIDFLKKEAEEARLKLETADTESPERGKVREPGKSENVPHNALALERDIDKKSYSDLLGKLRQAQLTVNLAADSENAQLGETWRLAYPASLPEDSDSPDRLLLATGGLVAGFVLGIALLLRLRFKRLPPEL